MPSHRRPPQHRLHRAHRYRRGPARLTLVVAAATLTVAGGASAGFAAAAGPPGQPSGADSWRAAAGSLAAESSSAAPGLEQQRTSPNPSSSRQPPAPGHTGAPAAGKATAPAGHPTATARNGVKSAPAPQTYLIYDSLLPAALPAGHVIATYADGPGAVSSAALAGRGPVLWIDVNATDPAANVLDIEAGNATPSAAPIWVSRRLSAYPGALAIIYTSISEWPAVQAAVATLPPAMRGQIRWWIADPTGYPHLVPGSDATQWFWGSSYDISTATARFLAPGRALA